MNIIQQVFKKVVEYDDAMKEADIAREEDSTPNE
jgi:hypothetical protein